MGWEDELQTDKALCSHELGCGEPLGWIAVDSQVSKL